jgi:hypothetical protein
MGQPAAIVKCYPDICRLKKSSASLQNCIRDARSIDRGFHVVGPHDVGTF